MPDRFHLTPRTSSHASEQPKGTMIMQLPIQRRIVRTCGQQGHLPAPGPVPARPSPHAVVIFVIVIVVVAWLLGGGYSLGAALTVVAAAGALAPTITSRLAGTLPVAG